MDWAPNTNETVLVGWEDGVVLGFQTCITSHDRNMRRCPWRPPPPSSPELRQLLQLLCKREVQPLNYGVQQ
jgi:hypothetical protein